MNQAQQLYRLQQLDSQLDQIEVRLAEIEASLGESEALIQARVLVKVAQEKLVQAQIHMRDLELEVKGLSEKIARQEKTLYSGTVKSAKEAANLQEEVASLKRRHENQEELLLEAMVMTEEAEEQVEQLQGKLEQTQADWAANQETLREERLRLQTEMTELTEQRPVITRGIEADALNTYESLRRKKAGRAVALVERDVCQACNVSVSAARRQRARSASELIFCGTCGRILYAP